MFCEMTTTNASAIAGAADFETLAAADAAGLLTGLTTECEEMVNYEPYERQGDAIPTLNQWGMMIMSGLLGLFGLGALSKRKEG